MNTDSPQVPRVLVLAIPLLVVAYVLGVGPEKFYYESVGTLILSPIIYLRFCPPGVALPVGRFLLEHPWAVAAICGVPVGMLAAAGVLGVFGYLRSSMLLSVMALCLVVVVFTTYHCLQPFGFTVLAVDWPAHPLP